MVLEPQHDQLTPPLPDSDDAGAAAQFLHPTLDHLLDPYALRGMTAAVARIQQLSPGSIVYLFTFKPDFYARV